ncbi:SusC/RagA family TonB-linked outer membrane protein [Hymenobacter profundi]|uniref:TonB-dependent receptor n=1 Tax=Hymenobacter profundi TaxID=1982110 RepID=A0ABS6WYR0_9BACT|nr:TonB-dependent receptor [Hymenobacter profundi]MBW3128730.1 TonB-dependent receptor [Hymenobacter profundi]
MKKTLLLSFVLMLALLTQAWAQNRTVTGRVTDVTTGEGMPGVTVHLKGTSTAAPTDANGNYTIGVPAGEATLVFTFIGYVNKEVAVGNQSTLNVALASDSQNLNEVVVVAYGTADPATYTGSVTQIGAEKLSQRPVTNVTNAIAGQAAGVQVSGGSGQPGAGPDIRIRGFSSVNYANDPLYVVDGVPYTAGLSNLNPEDIESISILKDAASTALYGSRATNGVVMVTTKRGKKDQVQVNVRALQGVSSRAVPEYNRVSAQQYYPLMWEAYRNSLVNATTTREQASQRATNDIKGLLGYNPFNVPDNQIVGTDGTLNPNAQLLWGDDLDWEKALSRNGSRSDYTASFNGGSGKSNYYVSLGYLNDKGYLIKSDFERFSGRMNVNSDLTKWLKAGVNMNYTLSNSNQANTGSSTGFVNPFFFSRGIGPIYPVYQHDPATGAYVLDAQGDRVYDLGGSSPTMTRPVYPGRHIVAETQYNNNLYRRNVLGGRTYGEITFLKDFKFTGNFAIDITNYEEQTYDNTIVGDGAPAGRAGRRLYNLTSYTANQLLNYNKTLAGMHNVEVLLGHENYNRSFDDLNGSKSGEIIADNTELQNFGTTNSFNTYHQDHRIESYFGRANYTFDDRYTVSGSYRRDGSSRFYEDVRWGSFWSVGGSWRLDKETFFTTPTWVDMLKLRSSYGQVGNENLSNSDGTLYYAWQALYTLGRNNAAEPGFSQATLGNQGLVWEKNNSFDVGMEFFLFRNRLTGTVEYFNRTSKDLLFEVPLPLSSGVANRIENIGSMYNRGVEIRLAGDIIKTKAFTWNLDVNWTTYKNEITKLPYTELVDGTKKLKVGHSLQEFWLREYYGVDPENGDALYRANAYNESNSKVIGTDTVTSNFNNARYHYAGTAIPKFAGGITNTFAYKGFTLSALLTYSVGGKFYDSQYATLMNHGTYGGAMHEDMLGRWQNPGDITNVPRLQVGNTNNLAAASDRFLIDASYLNFRSVSLGYSIPAALSTRLKLRNVNIFATGENLALITKRKGMNVAQTFSGTTSAVYVPARVLSLGMNLSL